MAENTKAWIDSRRGNNLWADMKEAGLVIKEEKYTTTIPRSQRGGEIVEPMISEQWFVKMESLANAGLDAVRDGRIKIVPERFEKTYFNWLENIKDWCISRQLWWGHRIPVWYCADGHMTVTREDPTAMRDLRLERDSSGRRCAGYVVLIGLVALLHAGLARANSRPEIFLSDLLHGNGLRYFLLLGGAHDHERTGIHRRSAVPHGVSAWLVRDEQGRKMSKTYGNVIDPLIVMDEFGTDALRFTLWLVPHPDNDMNLSVKKVEANRNFANKLWNVGGL
jgi:valyl-tRNA synthetase